MIYCPYCGMKINNDEQYCFNCGKKVPQDIENRIVKSNQTFNRLWYYPIGLLFLFLFLGIFFYIQSEKKLVEAEQLYKQSEEKILNQNYEQAKKLTENALLLKPNFTQAEITLSFVETAINIQKNLRLVEKELEASNFNQALIYINEAEHDLRTYRGEAVTELIDLLSIERNRVKLESVNQALQNNPTIDDLKILLWEAEAINMEEAVVITEHIRNQIVDYIYSSAIDQLNKYQFSDAQILIDDGLKYAINSEKLLSLQMTINKEQEAFETAQQERIEQAIDLAEEEREVNEMEAVKLQQAKVSRDEQGFLVVSGEVESAATIPINSVLIDYTLINESGAEYATNKAFIFPDTLYPGETGKFEFTHYEIDERIKDIDIQVNKFTWYTD